MSRRLRPLNPLEDEQALASAPREHAALSASAGTGKTHVLTARVLRLLLSGADPASILCLTFTKAGAAEMAQRIHQRLAYWVRAREADLRKDLFALGEKPEQPALMKARTLFARVLDAAGGGLRIQTIHAFAQSLLAAFPAEAGLVPGFRPLEGREEKLLARSTLAELLVRSEAQGNRRLMADVQALSHRLGEGAAEAFLRECARAPDAMTALGPADLIEDRLRRAFDLPLGDIDAALAEQCCDDLFDLPSLRAIAEANRSWGTATGLACCDLIAAWEARDPVARAEALAELAGVVLTRSGEPRKAAAGLLKADPDYADHAARLVECCTRIIRMRNVAGYAACLAAGLRAGQAFAEAWTAAKRAHGVVDFDDLIRWTERLLMTPGVGEWVRYKLDQATDHILVDEAQDTNEAQWNIVRALTLEFFAGEGAGRRHRTLFTVGDYKQAIFGFQGTNPESFEQARAWFAREAEGVGREFLDLSMDRSFRSAPAILEAVDRLIAELGHEALGLPRPPRPHQAHHARRPGSVTLWSPWADERGAPDDEAGEEGWVSDAVRAYATRVARQVRRWLDDPFRVEGKGRPLRPEDILILVRRRGDLAALLVARLHAEGVPVAGVDRLLLSAPLAVQDLLAALRFAAQPLDDLNLAALLVSPIFGWSQEELFDAAHERPDSLWAHLRDAIAPHPAVPRHFRDTVEGLHALLAMADYATPYAFLETLLGGPLDARRKLLERLGPEARDPIEELLSSALEFESAAAPSIQRFLDWFARGDVEIVRDPSAPLDAVRVMTVHGSKGLQAPVVLLADACSDPERARPGGRTGTLVLGREGPAVPVFRPRREELAEPLATQVREQERLEREEHWRLLYVALTRAEERLYVGGALGPADRGAPAAASWWSALEHALQSLGAAWKEDPLWGQALRVGEGELFAKAAARGALPDPPLPPWIGRPAPAEARPPRPLAPSSPGEDPLAEPPPSPAMRAAALRGRLLHQLFERLPDVPPGERVERAERWLEQSAGVEDPALRRTLVEDACRIISDPAFSGLFGPGALAEAPVAAVVEGGAVVAGTVDRLLVLADRILIAEFKTGRSVPARIDDVPVPHLRQVAAYVAALGVIFPGRAVEARLLYTAGPKLIEVPAELLARYRPALETEPPAP